MKTSKRQFFSKNNADARRAMEQARVQSWEPFQKEYGEVTRRYEQESLALPLCDKEGKEKLRIAYEAWAKQLHAKAEAAFQKLWAERQVARNGY